MYTSSGLIYLIYKVVLVIQEHCDWSEGVSQFSIIAQLLQYCFYDSNLHRYWMLGTPPKQIKICNH